MIWRQTRRHDRDAKTCHMCTRDARTILDMTVCCRIRVPDVLLLLATAISTDHVVHGLTPFEIWLGPGLGLGVLVMLVQMAGIQLADVLATQRSPNAPSPQNRCTSPPAGARRCNMDSSMASRGIWHLPDRCAASCASAGCRR